MFSGILVAFCVVMLYGIVMTPETASASRPDLNLDSLEVYFLYEDHIGRPVMVSEYEDYTPDGETPDGTYFKTWGNSDPIFHASYDPFGSINEDFDSTGIVVGNNNDTKITWSVPFRFPGQYQDPELEGIIFYNWNRYYSPAIGRYNRADPILQPMFFSSSAITSLNYIEFMKETPLKLHPYSYAQNNPVGLSQDKCDKEKCLDKAWNKFKRCFVFWFIMVDLPAAILIAACAETGPAFATCVKNVAYGSEILLASIIWGTCWNEYKKDVKLCSQ